jgi:hypothetical protein
MARKTRKLARSALALAATTVAEVAIQKLAEDPRVRRKAKNLARSAAKALKQQKKKLTRSRKPGPKRKAGRERTSASGKKS